MEKIINGLMVCFVIACGGAQAQTAHHSGKVYLSTYSVSQDTTKDRRRDRILHFTLKVENPDDLEKIVLKIIDKEERVIFDIGDYKMHKHKNGFYYIENESFEKYSVLNNKIYISSLLRPYQFVEVASIKISYHSTHDDFNDVITALKK